MTAYQFLLALAALAVLSRGIKVQCQYESSPRNSNAKFYISDRQVLVSTIYGVSLVVEDLDGIVSNNIKSSGTWQPHNLRAMAKLVKQGDTILNLGAHIGIQAIVLAKGVGPKGKMFAFEPTDLSYPMLLKNIYLNELEDRAVAYKMGASNVTIRGTSEVDNGNTGGARINTNPGFKGANRTGLTYYQVTLDRVDNVLPKGTVIDFVLIDVESMEVYAIQGMVETIARSPNIIIMCEWWGWYFKGYNMPQKLKQLDDLVRSMHERKFKFYYLDKAKMGCNDIRFIELSLEQVLSHTMTYLDIFYVQNHIDPNKL